MVSKAGFGAALDINHSAEVVSGEAALDEVVLGAVVLGAVVLGAVALDVADSIAVFREVGSDEEASIALAFAASTILAALDSTVWRSEDAASTVLDVPALDADSAVAALADLEAADSAALVRGDQALARSADSVVRGSDHSQLRVFLHKDSTLVSPPSSRRRLLASARLSSVHRLSSAVWVGINSPAQSTRTQVEPLSTES